MLIRSNDIVIAGDDLFYSYVLDENLVGSSSDIGPKIEGISDILTSQKNQYVGTGGRIPIHIIVQYLCSQPDNIQYALANALLFAAFVCLLICYTFPRNDRFNPLWWVSATIAGLYLFPMPGHLWWSVSVAMNYLLPMPLIIGFLLIWHRISNLKLSDLWLAPTIVLAFITGWSHESFSLPLAGSMVVYACIKRQNLNWQQWAMMVALWAGALILLSAPGNFHRTGGTMTSRYIYYGIVMLYRTWMVWLLLAAVIAAAISCRIKFRELIHDNIIIIIALLAAIGFAIVAHSSIQAYTGVALYSCLLIFKILSGCISVGRLSPKTSIMVSITVMILLIAHQAIILSDQHKINNNERAVLTQYLASPDSIIVTKCVETSTLSGPWLDKHLPITTTTHYNYYLQSYNNVYFNGLKPPRLVTQADAEEISNPQHYCTAERMIDGTARSYSGHNRIWSVNQTDDILTLTVRRADRSLSDKIMRMLNPDDYKEHSIRVEADITVTSGDTILKGYSKPWIEVVRADLIE